MLDVMITIRNLASDSDGTRHGQSISLSQSPLFFSFNFLLPWLQPQRKTNMSTTCKLQCNPVSNVPNPFFFRSGAIIMVRWWCSAGMCVKLE
ncbi:unnamed protein product, partial [Sphenostylis stenocarpa]